MAWHALIAHFSQEEADAHLNDLTTAVIGDTGASVRTANGWWVREVDLLMFFTQSLRGLWHIVSTPHNAT